MHQKKIRLHNCRKRMANVVIIFMVVSLFTLYHWIAEAKKTAHIVPQNPKLNIEVLLLEKDISSEEIGKISDQTGLHPNVIQCMLKYGQREEILDIQRAFYERVEFVSVRTTPLTVCEYVVNEQGEYTNGSSIVHLQDGDILLTKNSRFLGWRNGHVGLVVDAKKGLVLEALMLGTNTKLCSVTGWETYPSFLVLRLKEEFRNSSNVEKVVTYAKQNLLDIPYRLYAGIWNRNTESAISGTQCAHIVWYAYQQIGINLDSDGGFVVTPNDIQNSSYLEVIQSYGY